MFEKVRAAGGFAKENLADLEEVEKDVPRIRGDGEGERVMRPLSEHFCHWRDDRRSRFGLLLTPTGLSAGGRHLRGKSARSSRKHVVHRKNWLCSEESDFRD
jgi:hypothetical protein